MSVWLKYGNHCMDMSLVTTRYQIIIVTPSIDYTFSYWATNREGKGEMERERERGRRDKNKVREGKRGRERERVRTSQRTAVKRHFVINCHSSNECKRNRVFVEKEFQIIKSSIFLLFFNSLK